ncbi:MAG: hypothetical protein K2X82_15965 [Gemmataceae bacterium]|nr:hypothetical protein [Gemmataceae bacterium]
MYSRQIRIQSWVSIALGVVVLVAAVATGSSGGAGSPDNTGAGLGAIGLLAFVGIGALGLTTARGVGDLEGRLARLEPPGSPDAGGDRSPR